MLMLLPPLPSSSPCSLPLHTTSLTTPVHGNAGHIAEGYRTQTYQSITAIPHTHVLTCDYRGFGLSTGHPTETGLITDATTLVTYVLTTLDQPASRTLLLGQSLGTAVASATTLFYLDPHSTLLPPAIAHPHSAHTTSIPPVHFAATILVAPFTSMPSLLLTYRIAGLLPVLSPLRTQPRLLRFFVARIVDTWPSLLRLQAAAASALSLKRPLNLLILHARNDADIRWSEAEMLFEGLAQALKEGGGECEEVSERVTDDGVTGVRRGAWAYRKVGDRWVDERLKRNVELEITRYGGER